MAADAATARARPTPPRPPRRRSPTVAAASPACAEARPDPRRRRRAPSVRRHHRRRRRPRRGPARLDHRPDRSQRRRQDDVLQPADRVRQAERGRLEVRRPRDATASPPHKTAKLGMVRTFQLTKSLTKLAVIENMKLGATDQRGEQWWNGLIAVAVARAGGRDRGAGRRAARAVPARPHARRVRRRAVGRSAQAARDGPGADDQPDAGDARRADGRRQPGAEAEPQRAHPRACATRG